MDEPPVFTRKVAGSIPAAPTITPVPNSRKRTLLGESFGAASGRLRKAILFKYVKLAGHDICYRCHMRIETAADLSLDHTMSWQLAPDPVAAFFDTDAVAFSHLRCNIKAADRRAGRNSTKTHCIRGHVLDGRRPDGRRRCLVCHRAEMAEARSLP